MRAQPAQSIDVVAAPADFADWVGLLALLREAFAYMDGRIDPPSSLHSFDAEKLAAKAKEEELILALMGGALVGCLFAAPRGEVLYLGKIAVRPNLQGKGIAKRMFALAEASARARGFKALELQSRIELVENHRTFAALGFEKVGEGSHPGYTRSTDANFRKRL
ncbi:MAG TPA: GNAT family N-acetyltransferase [Kiloniellaceae bacterium]|nr:GNAT family N-acetyltransferase [Kiloniellaceae bacterium]